MSFNLFLSDSVSVRLHGPVGHMMCWTNYICSAHENSNKTTGLYAESLGSQMKLEVINFYFEQLINSPSSFWLS